METRHCIKTASLFELLERIAVEAGKKRANIKLNYLFFPPLREASKLNLDVTDTSSKLLG